MTDSKKTRTGNRQSDSGFTLLELIITLAIIAIMVAGTVPFAHSMIRREKELELRRNLRDIRKAIDGYYISCRNNEIPRFQTKPEDCYPADLQVLVDGYEPVGKTGGAYRRFLRRIPIDPFTGNADWGLRSMEDDPFPPTSGSGPTQSNGVFDVYSKAHGKALDGTEYSTW